MKKFQILIAIILLTGLAVVKSQSEDEENEESDTALETTTQTFKDYEIAFQKSVQNLLRIAFPYLYALSGKADMSIGCLLSFLNVISGTRNLEEWAIKLFDSSGKLSGGMLEGTAMALGDYDECQDIVFGGGPREEDSKVGTYCMIEVKPSPLILDAIKEYQVIETRDNSSIATSKTFLNVLRNIKSNPNDVAFRIGLCMPSKCTIEDTQSLVDAATDSMDFPATVKRCETKSEMKLQLHQEIILGIISIFLILVATGTLAELILSLCRENRSDDDEQKKNCFENALMSFSLINNTQKLMTCDLEGDALDPIRGIKVLTVLMGIFVHTYALPHPLHIYRYRSAFNFLKFTDQLSFSGIANSSAGIETFFFIAGFLSVYLRWRQIKKPPVGKYIIKFIGLNFLRMLLAQLLVVCLFMLAPIFGSGPLFVEFVEEPLNNCKRNWWSNLLFIQNFWRPYDACLYQTWILAVMMQLFLFTAITIYAMSWWPPLGVGTNVCIIFIAMVMVAIVTAVAGFPATFAVYFYDYRTALTMWKYLYVQAYNHIGPFCIGILVAYFCAEQKSVKISKPLLIFGWCSSIGTFLSIVYGLYDYRDGQTMHRALAVFYSAVHRPAWGLAVGWIVYACSTGNGGVVNSILSWKAFVPVERICYLMYLIHVPIMYFHGGIQREKLFMSHFNQAMSFISYTSFSLLMSYICYVIFQAPYTSLENFIFGRNSGNIWQVEPLTDSETNLKEESNLSSENTEVNVLFSKTSVPVSVVGSDNE